MQWALVNSQELWNMAEADSNQYDLYFAYGSNLNLEELSAAGAAYGLQDDAIKPVSPAWLPDMNLIFDYYSTSRGGGALNVQPAKGGLVSGYLLQLSQSAWKLLDQKEGHPNYYQRRPVTVLLDDGQYLRAQTYIARADRTGGFVAPTHEYLAICEAGRKKLGLDTRALQIAAEGQKPSLLDAVFCYGTLMRGECRFAAIAHRGLRCALLAETQGRLLDCGAYPGLVTDSDAQIAGEFFRSRQISKLLDELDFIEGFEGFEATKNLFRRTVRHVHVGDGRIRSAWVYLICDNTFPDLKTQDWRAANGRTEGVLERLLDSHAAANPGLLSILTERQYRYSPVPVEERRALDRSLVLDALKNGDISERQLAQISGVWAAGTGDAL